MDSGIVPAQPPDPQPPPACLLGPAAARLPDALPAGLLAFVEAEAAVRRAEQAAAEAEAGEGA